MLFASKGWFIDETGHIAKHDSKCFFRDDQPETAIVENLRNHLWEVWISKACICYKGAGK